MAKGKIRRLVDSIFHDSNNAAYTVGIRACLHASFAGITHYANPERIPALYASVQRVDTQPVLVTSVLPPFTACRGYLPV